MRAKLRSKRPLQAAALALVASLLVLLGLRVLADDNAVALAADVAAGKAPQAPPLVLRRLDGSGTLRLSALRGKVVLLNFWASWCVPCKQEARDLEAAYRRWRDRGVVVLGVDSEDYAGDGRSFARRYGLTYPLVHESGSSVKERYGVAGYPESYFIDRGGRVVHYVIGPLNPSTIDEYVRKSLQA